MVNKEEKHMGADKSYNSSTIQNDEFNLYNLWKVILKRKGVIITIFVISLLVATIYCITAPPIYQLETYLRLYMPKDITTVKEWPTAKDISSIIGKVDDEKKAIIFSKHADEISSVKIDEIRGSTDKFKITIESRNPESFATSLIEIIRYIENIREIKSNHEKIVLEIDERIKNVKEADRKNDFQIREIEKRLLSSKILPVGYDPTDVADKAMKVKMELYRLQQERQNYKPIQPLEDSFISKAPVKPYKILIISIASVCSLLLGIFLALTAEYFEAQRKRAQVQ